MAEEWRIAKSSRICSHSGAVIETAQPFYSALVEADASFERRDFSPKSWPEVNKTAFFSYWKNKGGDDRDGKRRPLDLDRLLHFFDRLEGAQERQKRLFRYVLALILARRRRLRLDDMSRTADGDRIVVYDRRNGRILEILSPEATRDELEQAQERLNQLFECDFAEAETPSPPDPDG